MYEIYLSMFINIYTYIFIEFISHQQMTSKSLWNDGIHLLDTGKSILGQNFEDRASFFFFFSFFFSEMIPF